MNLWLSHAQRRFSLAPIGGEGIRGGTSGLIRSWVAADLRKLTLKSKIDRASSRRLLPSGGGAPAAHSAFRIPHSAFP